MKAALITFALLATSSAAAQPRITSVDPRGVRVGGSFSVVIDASAAAAPFRVTVAPDRPPRIGKHTSDPIVDNGPLDEAPQKGIVRYRVPTDSSWLSHISLTRDSQEAKEQYSISLQPVATVPLSLTETVSLTTVTVFATPGLVDAAAAIDDDLNALLGAVLSIKKLTEAARANSTHVWHETPGAPGSSIAVQIPPDLAKKWASEAEKTSGSVPFPNYMLLHKSGADPKLEWKLDDPKAAEAFFLLQQKELANATAEFERSLSPEQKKLYAERLATLKQQLSGVAKQ